MDATELNSALLKAHSGHDASKLIGLYELAATQSNTDARRAYFLTYSYVLALEAGDKRAGQFRQALIEMGCETEE